MTSDTRTAFRTRLQNDLASLDADGLMKRERPIASPQDAVIRLEDGREVLNLCANNYLGLANHPAIVEAARVGLDEHGFGMASVRFICGTQTIHRELEARISAFLGTEDTILYSSCFDANGGLFETLLGEDDAIVTDSLNHASIIDGIRLCKARRFRYENGDMGDLERQLRLAREGNPRTVLIATDGVFSMDGSIADLRSVCDLADQYGALVMVDDSHAVGFVGENGRGSAEHAGVLGRIDLYTGTLGKALGGASGGYTSGSREAIAWLRQRSRPYLFSNTLSPPIVIAALKTFELLDPATSTLGAVLRTQLRRNATRFRAGLTALGFDLLPGQHPIIPVMLGDARLAQGLAERLLELGIYVIGFSFPVVPRGKARIRTQMSAAHTDAQIDAAILAFGVAGRALGVIPMSPTSTSGSPS
ncbi:MAG: glycine C-acetyltransferase [Myxococcales bacterium]|nr:glycine C-acetyltransferase [Myxococcales bacterium]